MKLMTLTRVKNIVERNLRDANYLNEEYTDPSDVTSDPNARSKVSEGDVKVWKVKEQKHIAESEVTAWFKMKDVSAFVTGVSQILFDLLTDSEALAADQTTVPGVDTITDGSHDIQGSTYTTGGNRTAGSGNIHFEVPTGKTATLKVGNYQIEVKDDQVEITDGTMKITMSSSGIKMENGSQYVDIQSSKVDVNGNFEVT